MSTAAAQIQDDATSANVALPLRNDTFLGVCEAIGQDLGINANWLRVAFAPFIIVNPILTLVFYVALGCVVAVSRWLFPRTVNHAPAATTPVETDEAVEERLAA